MGLCVCVCLRAVFALSVGACNDARAQKWPVLRAFGFIACARSRDVGWNSPASAPHLKEDEAGKPADPSSNGVGVKFPNSKSSQNGKPKMELYMGISRASRIAFGTQWTREIGRSMAWPAWSASKTIKPSCRLERISQSLVAFSRVVVPSFGTLWQFSPKKVENQVANKTMSQTYTQIAIPQISRRHVWKPLSTGSENVMPKCS